MENVGVVFVLLVSRHGARVGKAIIIPSSGGFPVHFDLTGNVKQLVEACELYPASPVSAVGPRPALGVEKVQSDLCVCGHYAGSPWQRRFSRWSTLR